MSNKEALELISSVIPNCKVKADETFNYAIKTLERICSKEKAAS